MGSGTINPITGMREYSPWGALGKVGKFLGSTQFGAIMWGADMIMSAFGKNRAKKAAAAARTASAQQLASDIEMIGKETVLQEEQNVLNFESSRDALTSKTTSASAKIAGMDEVPRKANMANVEMHNYAVETAKKQNAFEAWSTNKNIVETRNLNERNIALGADRNKAQARGRENDRLRQINSMV